MTLTWELVRIVAPSVAPPLVAAGYLLRRGRKVGRAAVVAGAAFGLLAGTRLVELRGEQVLEELRPATDVHEEHGRSNAVRGWAAGAMAVGAVAVTACVLAGRPRLPDAEGRP